MFSFGQTSQIATLTPHVMVLIIASGIIGIAVAHLLFYIAVKRIGVAIASSANLASAFITAVFSRILFKEMLTTTQWLAGLIMILGGILLTQAQVHVLKGRSPTDS